MSKYSGVVSIVEVNSNVHSSLGSQIKGVLLNSNLCSECISYLFTRHNGEYVHHIYLESEKLLSLQDIVGLAEIKNYLSNTFSSTQLYFDIDSSDNLGIYFGEISLTLFNTDTKEFSVSISGQQDSTKDMDTTSIENCSFSSLSLDWLAKHLNFASCIFSALRSLQLHPSQLELNNIDMLEEFTKDYKTIYTCLSLHHMCEQDRKLAIKAVHSLFLQD